MQPAQNVSSEQQNQKEDYTPAQSVIYELNKHEKLQKMNGAKIKSQVLSSFSHKPKQILQNRKVYRAGDQSSLMMVPTRSNKVKSKDSAGAPDMMDDDLILMSDKEFRNMQQILNKSDDTAPDAHS